MDVIWSGRQPAACLLAPVVFAAESDVFAFSVGRQSEQGTNFVSYGIVREQHHADRKAGWFVFPPVEAHHALVHDVPLRRIVQVELGSF